MAGPRLGVTIATDYDAAGFRKASEDAKLFGAEVQKVAAKNLERTVAQKERLRELSNEYLRVAASAKEGSIGQIAALDAAARAQKRLGTEVLATNTAIRESAHKTALAEREIGRFARGGIEATGGLGRTGLGLALGSGGFLAGAATVGAFKVALDARRELMDAEEQLGVAVDNTGKSWERSREQVDAYVKSESARALFTRSSLTAGLVGLVRATGSVSKAERDETLATNLARGAHIDLATATQDLINLEGGRTRGLVTLGVKIPVVKTATDALRASGLLFTGQQKAEAAALDRQATAMEGKRKLLEKYAGSSKAFSDSSASSSDRLKKSVNDLATSIGGKLVPKLAAVENPLANFLDDLASGKGSGLGSEIHSLADEIARLTDKLNKVAKPFGGFFGILKSGIENMGAFPAIREAMALGNLIQGKGSTATPGTGIVASPTAGGVAGLTGGTSSASGRSKMLQLAESAIGTPYLWGGAGPGGFDCSGLVQWAFANGLNVNIPRTTYGQVAKGKLVGNNTLKGAKPGDVIFTGYGEGGNPGPGHEGLYLGGGKVLSAPHTGGKVGITDLAGFTGGGAARFSVRDLLGAAGGGSSTAAADAALRALLAQGKKKPVKEKIAHGSSLIGDQLLGLITLDKNNASTSSGSIAHMWLERELGNLKDARDTVAAKMKGASPKQATAIKAELRTIDTQIAGVNKSIATNLKAQGAAIKASFAATISSEKSAITSAMSGLIGDIQTAFTAATQDYITNTLGPKFSQGGLLTPKEQQYADMQAADTAKSLTDGLGAAQKQLADDMNGALIEHIVDISTGATKDIFGPSGSSDQIALDKDAVSQAQRMIDENELSIAATAERKIADKAYADAVTQYQQQRSDAEHAMTRELTALGVGISKGTDSISELPGVLEKYGLTAAAIELSSAGQFSDDMESLGSATRLLAQTMIDEALALSRIGNSGSAAAVQQAAALINLQPGAQLGSAGVASGSYYGVGSIYNPTQYPHMAAGGDILRDGLAYLHAGERVQPAHVVAGAGGGMTFAPHFSFPNYVGSHDELSAVLKSPQLVEAIATAFLMANRRGHVRAAQIN